MGFSSGMLLSWLLVGPSFAATIAVSKTVNPMQLAEELQRKTGYSFTRTCESVSCTVSGHLISRPGQVEIEVYEKAPPEAPWVVAVTVDAKLRDAIREVVAQHVPKASRPALRPFEGRVRELAQKWKSGQISDSEKDELIKAVVLKLTGVE